MHPLARTWSILSAFVGARRRLRGLRGDALARWQHRHGTETAAFALQHSPFYRELAGGLPAERWREFPIIDKATMMADYDRFNTAGVPAARALEVALRAEETRDFSPTVDGLTVVLSSGTSGHRTLSLVDEREQYGFMGLMMARMLPAWPVRPWRVAFFLRSNSNLYEASRSALVTFRYFDLVLSRDEIVARLRALSPNVIVGPPAMLVVLAELVEQGLVSLRPEVVFSGAEVLEAQDRARVEAALGVPVRDVYHTTEGLIGLACEHGRMHLQEDVTAIELEPLGDGRFTPVITQLFRRVQPFIRYRMNDVVTLDDAPCPCGSAFRVLGRVEGRCDDVFFVRRTDGTWRRVFADHVRRAVLQTDGVVDYRAEQRAADHVVVHVAAASDTAAFDASAFDEGVLRGHLKAQLEQDGGAPVTVDVVRGVPPPADARKKLVRVRRLFSPPPDAVVR